MLNQTSVVDKVQSQFPEFYTEYGSSFIDFTKIYFQWLEDNQYTGPTKNIPSLLDIDETTDLFLKFFKKEYMDGMPEKILGNQRYLQKHILDIYRSKGSDEGLRLLFRLLYNKEIDIYIPAIDIMKPSHGGWVIRKYMEVTDSTGNSNLEGKQITGENSKATAIVEAYEKNIYNGIINHVLWVSSITGEFLIGEKVYADLDDIQNSPCIKGSVSGLNVITSKPFFALGDQLTYEDDTQLKFAVSELNPVDLNGIIEPKLLKIGNGYREGHIDITYEKRVANGPGTDFELGYTLKPTGIYRWMTDVDILPFANTSLNAADYSMPSANTENINSNIQLALQFSNDELQDVYAVYATDSGYGYETIVDVYLVDQEVSELKLFSEDNQTYLGNNAIVEGYAVFGEDRASKLKVVSSSFNYTLPKTIELSNDTKTLSGNLELSAIGVSEGYYINQNSFLSDNKYIQDSFYYQEYSYDIKIDEVFEKYFDILLKVVHPAGKKAFGNIRIVSEIENKSSIETIFEEIT